jgi:integrase
MSKRRLTDKFLKSIKPAAPGKRVSYQDDVVPSLYLRVTDKGVMSWSLVTRYGPAGAKRWIRTTFGQYPAVVLAQARERAREALAIADKGIDPNRAKEEERLEHQEKDANSFAAVATRYLERYCRAKVRSSTYAEYHRVLLGVKPIPGKRKPGRKAAFHLRHWQQRPFADIRKRDVLDVLERIKLTAPVQSNRVRAILHGLWEYAVDCEIAEANLIAAIKRRRMHEEKARERSLGDEEIKTLWNALPAAPMGEASRRILKLVLLTGQRKGEVCAMEWSDIDLTSKLWAIPEVKFKGRRPHEVPLSDAATAILNQQREIKINRWVFPSVSDDRPIAGTSVDHAVRRWLENGLKIEHWTPHDLRRTMRTQLALLGISDELAERVIGHAQDKLTQTYNVHRYREEKRRAVDAWAARLDEIVTGKKRENVLRIHAV